MKTRHGLLQRLHPRLLRHIKPGLLIVLLASCSSVPVDKRVTASATTPELHQIGAALWPLSIELYRTTDASIYLSNLDARIENYRHSANSGTELAQARLASALYHRYKVLGRLADAEEALILSEAATSGLDIGMETRLLRITVLSGFHRFAEARTELQRARQRIDSTLHSALRRVEQDLAVATGDYASLAHDFETSLQPVADLFELAHRADLRVLKGDLAGAEFQFRAAQSLYHDVNPVPLAWLHTQMGIALLRFGQVEQASRFFAAATARLPGYVLAEEHLAECEFLLGQLDTARKRYLRVVESTQNPEYMAALAQVEHARGDRDSAAQWNRRARSEFQRLLDRHPEAFSAHAAEHLLRLGEHERAYALALENRRWRSDLPSELLLARAAEASGRHDRACSAWARIAATGLQPPELQPAPNECPPQAHQGNAGKPLALH